MLASLASACSVAPRLQLAGAAASKQLAPRVKAFTSFAKVRQTHVIRHGSFRVYAAFAGHDASFKNASCGEISGLLKDGSHSYLDVRTVEEFQAGHVPGACNVPVWVKGGGGMQPNPEFLKEVEARFADKGVPLVVGCKSGKRSVIRPVTDGRQPGVAAEAACDMMTKAGFSGLTNMTGGFDDWAAQNLPVEK